MSKYNDYQSAYNASVTTPEIFWAEQARRIAWKTEPTQIVDTSLPPFVKWFPDGITNLCHNAVDRWVKERGDHAAVIYVSTETGQEITVSYRQLHQAVQEVAAGLRSLGVTKGDRVLVYMPMVLEAIYTMLACARIGAIHSVVFGGFASHSLASRIDDAKPKVIVSADAGMRGGKVIPYKPLLDQAIELAHYKPEKVILVNRSLVAFEAVAGRDIDYHNLMKAHKNAQIPVTWLKASDTSYILYTSGTTGKPKGVARDVGGYAVALATSMEQVYFADKNDVFFCTSDIGWVVGHSYIVYGPLLNGMTTVIYEGLPIRPDAGVWWSIVEKYHVTHMFSSPTAVRVLKKYPTELMTKYQIGSLKALFLAGEPLDETTTEWVQTALKVPIIDNYWQTETGWPILSVTRGIEAAMPTRLGSPGKPMMGYKVDILNEKDGKPCGANEKGVLVLRYPLPPGCMRTVWGDDDRFIRTYWANFPDEQVYSTFDWGVRDRDGFYFILGRTDDVINVAGHRLGTREIEESILSCPTVAEVAVVGIEDSVKGQIAVGFAVLKDVNTAVTAYREIEKQVLATVDSQLGAVARPARIYFVNLLPKTRSGKLLRRTIQALCEGRETGDITTIEDAGALEQIREALASQKVASGPQPF